MNLLEKIRCELDDNLAVELKVIRWQSNFPI
jgi:hypothetical protein